MAVVGRVEGPALREIVRPWLADAQFDKVSRVLTLRIRRFPAVAGVQPHSLPGRD